MTEYFISWYDPETESIKTGFVDSRIFKDTRINLEMKHEINKDHPVDDEFARRFGGAALLWFATQHPELRAFLEVTDGKGNKVSI
jgi:hypothetical protein